jgi:hypothetical protein
MINPNTFNIIIKPRASTPLKATLGGKDAQSIKNARDCNLDFKTTSNSFRVVKDQSLRFLGRRNPPFFKYLIPLLAVIKSISCI